MIDIGFSGTRQGMSGAQHQAVENLFRVFTFGHDQVYFHHGDCVGADEQAHEIAVSLGWFIVLHPPINREFRAKCKGAQDSHEPAGYFVRNQRIADECDFLITAPLTRDGKGGTWDTIERTREARKLALVVDRNGRVEIE